MGVVCRVGDGACGGVGVGVCVWPYLLNVWKLEPRQLASIMTFIV